MLCRAAPADVGLRRVGLTIVRDGSSNLLAPPTRNPMASEGGIDLPNRVLYRDSQIIVIDKPAGLPVHGGPRANQSIESMLGALKLGLAQPPIPAHRLDH